MRRPGFRWVPALLALGEMGLLWWFSDHPATGMGLPHPWDKGVHFLAYGFLGFLLGVAFGDFRPALLLAALYGVVDEGHQSWVPGREAFGWDLVADFLGAYLGARWGGRWGVQEAFRPWQRRPGGWLRR